MTDGGGVRGNCVWENVEHGELDAGKDAIASRDRDVLPLFQRKEGRTSLRQ